MRLALFNIALLLVTTLSGWAVITLMLFLAVFAGHSTAAADASDAALVATILVTLVWLVAFCAFCLDVVERVYQESKCRQ